MCARSPPYFRGEVDIQGQILSLQRMPGRERSTRHWSLGDVGRGRLGVFMASAEVVSLPRLGRWQLITRKVFMKLQSGPRLVLMLCAHGFSFSLWPLGASSYPEVLVLRVRVLLSKILRPVTWPWASSQMGLTHNSLTVRPWASSLMFFFSIYKIVAGYYLIW